MFQKKETLSFYDMLINHATLTRDAVKALCVFCENPTQETGDAVKAAEVKADDARHLLVSEIHKSFITPIDREDLFRLCTCVDDLADYAWTTVKELRIYDILPDENLKQLATVLLEMADTLVESIQNLEKNAAAAAEAAYKVKKMENVINKQFHESIASLFALDDLRIILKYREIYNHINHASDKGDAAADILLDTIVKQ